MYTTEQEITEQIEQLRQNSLPPVWAEYAATHFVADPLEQLEMALLRIKDSTDKKLLNDAKKILVDLVDIDVDVSPTVTLTF